MEQLKLTDFIRPTERLYNDVRAMTALTILANGRESLTRRRWVKDLIREAICHTPPGWTVDVPAGISRTSGLWSWMVTLWGPPGVSITLGLYRYSR